MEHAKKAEIILERGLFSSRWLMAPMYAGLVGALLLLLWVFFQDLFYYFDKLPNLAADDAVLAVLSLIDLTLAGNLVLIVIFSGYSNFVSKLDIDDHEDRPDWQGSVDFTTLKLKLVASIVAISGIHLLKIFMDVHKYSEDQIRWMVIIHLVFVISGVLLALMDFVAARAKGYKK